VIERPVTSHEAADAFARVDVRQRQLRTAYTVARYGWPEGPAIAWRDRPQTFGPAPPGCRATWALEGLGTHG